MSGIFSIMDIGKWAMFAATKQLDTISHNVANVNTEGYSRQEVVQTTRYPEFSAEGWYGRGVSLETVIQYSDALLDRRITDKLSDQAYYDNRLGQLDRLEAMANESEDTALGSKITAFFSAWQDLSNTPESTALREALAESARDLATHMQQVVSDVELVQRDMDGYLNAAVDEVNSMCKRIAELNGQISASEAAGHTANDLRDERVRLVKDLSEMTNIQWFEQSDGSITVFTGKGRTLVQAAYPLENDQGPLIYQPVAGYDYGMVVHAGDGQVLTTSELSGGKMGAWLQVRDEDCEDIKTFMDELAKTLVAEVNMQHSQGAGTVLHSGQLTGSFQMTDAATALNSSTNTLPHKDIIEAGSFDIWVYEGGAKRSYTVSVSPFSTLTDLGNNINSTLSNGNDPVARIVNGDTLEFISDSGVEFAFANDTSNVLAALGINTFFTGFSAATIGLNEAIDEDTGLIAAGRLLADGSHAVGDNSNALDIADIKDADTMASGSQTFNESVISWSSSFGSTVATTRDNQEFAEVSVNQLNDMRDSVSAVSLDEEMVKMIKYQRSFQASAKLISTADEMLLSVLQIKG